MVSPFWKGSIRLLVRWFSDIHVYVNWNHQYWQSGQLMSSTKTLFPK